MSRNNDKKVLKMKKISGNSLVDKSGRHLPEL